MIVLYIYNTLNLNVLQINKLFKINKNKYELKLIKYQLKSIR